jgi:hypothetical protein
MSTGSIHNPVSIGKVVQNAVAFNFKHWRDPTMTVDDLLQTVERFFTLLEQRQVEYVLVGGSALLNYIEGRNAEDIDLIMAVAALQQLPEVTVSTHDADFARGTFDQLQIAFLLTRNPLFDTVRRQYVTRPPFAERTIPCATVEGLLLLKLYALPSMYRQGNFPRVGLYENDIATLMYQYRPWREPLFAQLAPHVSPTDLTSVREIVTEIEQRIARVERGQGNNS